MKQPNEVILQRLTEVVWGDDDHMSRYFTFNTRWYDQVYSLEPYTYVDVDTLRLVDQSSWDIVPFVRQARPCYIVSDCTAVPLEDFFSRFTRHSN